MADELRGVPDTLQVILGLIEPNFDRTLRVFTTNEINQKVQLPWDWKRHPALVICEVWEEPKKGIFSSKMVEYVNPIVAICTDPGAANRWDTIHSFEVRIWEEAWIKITQVRKVNELLEELAQTNQLRGGVMLNTIVTR